MTLTLGTRRYVILVVQDVAPSPAGVTPTLRRSWFTPLSAGEIAARSALRATLTREREQWMREFFLRPGGMAQ